MGRAPLSEQLAAGVFGRDNGSTDHRSTEVGSSIAEMVRTEVSREMARLAARIGHCE